MKLPTDPNDIESWLERLLVRATPEKTAAAFVIGAALLGFGSYYNMGLLVATPFMLYALGTAAALVTRRFRS